MADIVLTTLNAKYAHTAFGLRYLLANLGPLQASASLFEFDLCQRPLDIVETLLAQQPQIVGLGVYICNVAAATEVVATLKRLRPDLTVVLGGPEVSYEVETQPIVQLADYVIAGEGDLAFAELCGQLLSGQQPDGKIIATAPPDLTRLVLPYDLYNAADIAHRLIYVEASRGCPFGCEFCLSSLDTPVRTVPRARLFDHLLRLMERGARQFKFVDRTFNLNLEDCHAILEFLLAHHRTGHFYHFELIPDRLPESLREVLARFPPGTLQLEIGVQTFNAEAAARIQRRQNYPRLEDNFRFLRNHTKAHLHADLIVGLPGEDLQSFAAGFDRLLALRPHEIQVGILKRLRGAPIARHDAEWEMVYNPHPPYDILQNRLLDFATLQKLRRFARYWDLVGNSGNFRETLPLIWSRDAEAQRLPNSPALPETDPTSASLSPFTSFLRWSEWLHARAGRTDGIALTRLAEFLFEYLTADRKLETTSTAAALWRDYQRGGRRDQPSFLKPYLPPTTTRPGSERAPRCSLKRQARHWD